jgi:ADP-ribosylglycohydrolase
MIDDKLLGLVFGQAVGDAVGRYTEFMYADQIMKKYPNKEDFIFPSPDKYQIQRSIPECHWTDDTDQMILLMEMLIKNNNKIDEKLFAIKLRNWVENGRPELGYNHGIGVGNMTYNIVNNLNFLNEPLQVSKKAWQGILAPNGSVMRTSIMAYRNLNYEQTINDAIKMSLTTHYDPRCSISVAVITSILWNIINDTPGNDILSQARKLCSSQAGSFKHFGADYETSYEEEALKYFDMLTLEEMDLNNQIGYCLKCMACGVYAFRNRHRPYKDVILDIILAGGDADTNASPAGAILGVFQGFDSLPNEWLKEMPHNKWLLDIIIKFQTIIN